MIFFTVGSQKGLKFLSGADCLFKSLRNSHLVRFLVLQRVKTHFLADSEEEEASTRSRDQPLQRINGISLLMADLVLLPWILPRTLSHSLPLSSQDGRNSRAKHQGCSEHISAQRLRNSLSPQHTDSPVLFTRDEQRPSSGASGMVLFGGSGENCDDSASSSAASSHPK